jgi:hypothetical protein
MMKKIVLFTLATIILILISCEMVKSQNSPDEVNGDMDNKGIAMAHPAGEEKPLFASTPESDAPTPIEEPPQDKPKEPVTQYNTKELDDAVRREAKLFNKNPNTYRMLVRTEPNGNKIYRMIGMHVIQTPNSEEFFLPDEL